MRGDADGKYVGLVQQAAARQLRARRQVQLHGGFTAASRRLHGGFTAVSYLRFHGGQKPARSHGELEAALSRTTASPIESLELVKYAMQLVMTQSVKLTVEPFPVWAALQYATPPWQ